MAPVKSTRNLAKFAPNTTALPLTRKGSLRRTAQKVQDQNANGHGVQTRGKRKAENSPASKNEKIKRSALGNLTNNVKLTNNITQHPEEDVKEQKTNKDHDFNYSVIPTQVLKDVQNDSVKSGPTTRQQVHKISTRASVKNAVSARPLEETADAVKLKAPKEGNHGTELQVPLAAPAPVSAAMPTKVQPKPMRRISNEFEKTEETLYMSALEDISSCESMRLSGTFEAAKRRSVLLLQQEKLKTDDGDLHFVDIIDSLKMPIPEGVEDFDKVNWNDPFQASHYAYDIFNYLREREAEFPIDNYMEKQIHLSKSMRSLLVDWMVEVQETFELNHETLYLAVKIVDLFLCRIIINKDKLQLLGAAALFIACKYDERTPPLIEDFLYICDGAYHHDELIKMEMKTLQTINYDLGIPLSYRFLRRYARCTKVPMPTLTLARYILELSLMDYDTIGFSDSKLASASLFMALRLHGAKTPWTQTLEYYSSYKLADFAQIVPVLNACMHRKPKGTIKTIRCKYSHKIFHEVAKVPLMTNDQLFEHNICLKGTIQKDTMPKVK